MSFAQQRSKISDKNKYYIPKHRYLELKNFCLQYKDWKLALKEITLIRTRTDFIKSGCASDPTNEMAIKRLKYENNIRLIEETAELADPAIAKWLLKGVTESVTYDYLSLQLELSVCRSTYYDRYRRFFWLLDKKRI